MKTVRGGSYLLTVGGMISLGKTSVSELLGRELGSAVYYESVEDNKILPLFYTASEEEIQAKRYPFLLQLYFLDTRFKSIKKALHGKYNVLDRSIFEDRLFAKINHDLGRISDLEMEIYEGLFDNMMEEIEELPKKAPDIMIYLHGSFETVLERIAIRGRDFEVDESLKSYYKVLWEGYKEWIKDYEKQGISEVIYVNMDEIDVVNNSDDAKYVVDMVKAKLTEMGLWD
ncbi:deoxynucleoside kinase [Risungbinella massiliensis]|uniref:deoxynucleoside kinase n=1 Tax=Risungbinella massiliensis TaxID=1329796 RepID=UPI0005CB828B|nr:deoxynucleoside kinase [Risungbinella massiliensis]